MVNRALAIALICLLGPAVETTAAPAMAVYQPLPSPGRKVPLGSSHYFTFGFVKSPKVGTAIMRVEIFTLDGQRDRGFIVKGDADMPSMRGAHSTGDKNFVLSAKGAYLLPVHVAMPGDWELKFTFEKDGAVAFRGVYLFDV